MDERPTIRDQALLERLHGYFATELRRAEGDFVASPLARRANRWPRRLGGAAACLVAIVIVVVGLSNRGPSLPAGAIPVPGLAGLDLGALGEPSVVVATADGAAIVRRSGDMIELLVAVPVDGQWRVSVIDRTPRIPAADEAAGPPSGGWYAAGDAIVCDEASGLRDAGFIYGWLSTQGADRIVPSGVTVLGDGRLVEGLFLFVTLGTPETGSRYTLTPTSEVGPDGQPLHFKGPFGIPAPVRCEVGSTVETTSPGETERLGSPSLLASPTPPSDPGPTESVGP